MLPLFSYFQQLQQSGYALGMGEYKLLVEALGHKETSPETAEDLLRLCRHLWYKPGQNIKVFEDLFWQFFEEEQKQAHVRLEEEEKRLQQVESATQRQTSRAESTTSTSGGGSEQSTSSAREAGQPEQEVQPDDARASEQALGSEVAVPENQEEFIFLNIHPRAGASGSIAIDTGNQEYELQRTFSFEGGYAPLSRRELQNLWRYLPTRQLDKRDSNLLDVKATVKEIARIGEQSYFQPKFHQEYMRESGLFLLVDHLGSMIAFDDFASEVEAAALDWFLQHDKASGIRRYYFQNIPEKHLYLNTSHSEFHQIKHLHSKFGLSPKPMLIISDAGAAKGMFNEQRVEATAEALKALSGFASPIVWLNPLPAKRWEDTSAQAINHILGGTMCEATPIGFMRAIDILRGKNMV
jgi:uncharacterized protein with von Willebrand factor type A (vWA) domain